MNIRHYMLSRRRRREFTCIRFRRISRGLCGALCLLPLLHTDFVEAQKPQGKPKPHTPPTKAKASSTAGHTLFLQNCSPCHGAKGQGGEGPNLQVLTLSDALISTTIKKGIKGEMPAFGSKFKDADVKALTAYIHSIKK